MFSYMFGFRSSFSTASKSLLSFESVMKSRRRGYEDEQMYGPSKRFQEFPGESLFVDKPGSVEVSLCRYKTVSERVSPDEPSRSEKSIKAQSLKNRAKQWRGSKIREYRFGEQKRCGDERHRHRHCTQLRSAFLLFLHYILAVSSALSRP